MQSTTIPTSDDLHARVPAGSWAQHDHHQHGVQFYSQDEFLLEELGRYIGGALRAGNAAIVVATEDHRSGLLQRLMTQGFDVAALRGQNRLVVLDAAETLATFMDDGWPSDDRFGASVGGIIERAGVQGGNKRIAIFGEMVALLWASGKAEAAIRLEQLWNGLAETTSFSLFCAYPMSAFGREEDAELFLKVCHEHSTVIPTEAYTGLESEDERQRTISLLQQKSKALETEVAEHKRLRQELDQHVQARTAELQSKNLQLQQEITRREGAEISLRTLTSQLMLIRDEERRRVAHELHESTAQLLAALAMNLRVLRESEHRVSSREARLVTDSATLVENLLAEVRQLSHLLHPPTLDEIGLPSAIQWYVERFAKRTAIKVTLEVADDFGRLSREREIAVFRVIQESLANVHQHSGSPVATVRIRKSPSHVCVEVSDLGKGMPTDPFTTPSGVGINGMRERIRQLGGVLTIHSNNQGTLVTADLPS